MVAGLEQERKISEPAKEVVKEVEDTPEPTPELQEAGVRSVPTQFTAKVTHKGQQLVQAPATKTVTITIPATQGQLDHWAKGSPSNALTWFAAFWLRVVKKALYFGWKVVAKNPQTQQTQ